MATDASASVINKGWVNQLVSTFNETDSENDWRIESIGDVVEKSDGKYYKVKWVRYIWQHEDILQPLQQLMHSRFIQSTDFCDVSYSKELSESFQGIDSFSLNLSQSLVPDPPSHHKDIEDFNVSSGEDDGGNGGDDDECHSDTMITNNVDESKPVGSGSSTSDVVENELGNYNNNNTETNSLHVSRDNQCLESETNEISSMVNTSNSDVTTASTTLEGFTIQRRVSAAESSVDKLGMDLGDLGGTGMNPTPQEDSSSNISFRKGLKSSVTDFHEDEQQLEPETVLKNTIHSRIINTEQSTPNNNDTKIKGFTCEKCGKSFTRKTSLERHDRVHTGEKPFECDICGKRFSQKSVMHRHLLVHNNIMKPYQCELCQKTFSEKTAWRRHYETHSQKKPYQCDKCDKKFGLKEYLSKHMFLHTGLKPHKCEYCKKSFADPSALKRHYSTHNGGVACFQCSVCFKHFKSERTMTHHKKTCQSVYCVLCKVRFNSTTELDCHARKFHSNDLAIK